MYLIDTFFYLSYSCSYSSSRASHYLHVFIIGDEALMLPQWISHHASMFHRAYLLDYNSTDNSMQIARAFAPASWKIIPSRMHIILCLLILYSLHTFHEPSLSLRSIHCFVRVGNTVFASRSTDDELIDYEARHPHAWKIILTLGTSDPPVKGHLYISMQYTHHM